jgi:ABC-type branched-subunit amino acid transport system substrate-binding protein
MNRVVAKFMACLLALALVATLGFGCAKQKKPAGEVDLVVGYLTDLSGPVSSVMKGVVVAMNDYLTWMQENDPIPGARIKVYNYDTKYDPSRELPGYDWVLSKGAILLHVGYVTMAEDLKDRSAADKIPMVCPSASIALLQPDPEWFFGYYPLYLQKVEAMLQWLTDTEGTIKLGLIGWQGSSGSECQTGITEFMDANPGKIDLVDSILTAPGTVSFPAEVERLKDCDYIWTDLVGAAEAGFMKQYRDAGYNATFLGDSKIYNFWGMLKSAVGAEELDGTLVANVVGWWTDQTPLIELCNQILDDTHSPDDAAYYREQLGGLYYEALLQTYIWTEVFRDAVAQVGAANVDRQAWYNAAIHFERDNVGLFEGYGKWSYSDTQRLPHPSVQVWKWDAASDGLVKVSDWIAFE